MFTYQNRINSTNYKYWWDIMADLTRVLLALKDPHTAFIKGAFAALALQPLKLLSRFDVGSQQQIIFFSGLNILVPNSTFYKNFDLEAYIGATVLQVDGDDAFSVLVNEAKGLNGYYSKSTNLFHLSFIFFDDFHLPVFSLPYLLSPSFLISILFSTPLYFSSMFQWLK